jgi:hypothetical protein
MFWKIGRFFEAEPDAKNENWGSTLTDVTGSVGGSNVQAVSPTLTIRARTIDLIGILTRTRLAYRNRSMACP